MKKSSRRGYFAAMACMALVYGAPAHAYDAPWNGWREDITGPGPEPEVDCEGGECGPPSECNTGSPVYTARGSLVWSDTDVRFPGATRVGLTRTYNSFDFRAGIFGRGWMTSQETSIARTYKALAQGSADGSPTTATAFASQPVWLSSYGRRYRLQESTTACTPPQVLYFTFEKQADGSFQQVFEDSSSYAVYSDSGRLLESYSELDGINLYYDYDAQGRLVRQHDSHGFTLNFRYNERGFVAEVADQAQRTWFYSYDDDGNLVQVVDADGVSRDYGYLQVDNKGYKQYLLRSVHDNRVQQVLSVTWSRITLFNKKAMRVTGYTGRDGYRHDYSYAQSSYNGVAAVSVVKNSRQVDSNAIIETRSYIADAQRYWILQQSSSRGTSLLRSFDGRGQLVELRDERGNTSRYEYNAAGRTTRVTQMAGTASERITRIGYLDNSSRIAQIDEYGLRETRFSYDADKRLLRKVLLDLGSGRQRSWSYSYYPNSSDGRGNPLLGRLARVDGPQPGTEDSHQFFYDQQGLLSRVERPLGQALTFTYNSAGQLIAAVDANGVAMELHSDSRNRPLEISRGGRTLAIGYTSSGLISSITDELGRETVISYNEHDQPLRITYASGDRLDFSYLHASSYTEVTRRLSRADGAVVSTGSSRHDAVSGLPLHGYLGGAVELAVQHQYNGLDDLLQTTLHGQFGNTTGATTSTSSYGYDSEGRLRQVEDGLNGVTSFSYDLFDRVTQVADANGGATRYDYSAWGEVLRLLSPDSGSSGYEYDAAGNLVSAVDANGLRTAYSHDALSRLAGIDYAGDELDVRLSYDEGTFGKGRLTAVTDGSGSSSYHYDDRGLLLQSSAAVAGQNLDVSYGYNDAGQLVGIGYPSGAWVSYSYDNAGRLSAIGHEYNGVTSALLDDISWHGHSMAGYRQGNGIVTALIHDAGGRLVEKRFGSDESLWLGLDRQGQVTSQEWGRGGATASSAYRYDRLGRLTHDGVANEAFSYDAVGNRLTRQTGASSEIYGYDANSSRLVLAGSGVIRRDAAGNRLDDGVRQFHYDAANRLAGLHSSDTGVQASYSYNYRGERVRKQLAGATTADIRFVYGQHGELLGEYDSGGGLIREYIHVDGAAGRELLAQIEADGAVLAIHTDHLATPRLATAQDRSIVWRWSGDAFGATDADGDPDGDGILVTINHRFPGQYYDAESGLHYNLHRYYDPASGRYTSSDPIGLAGGLNTYSYAGANPLKYTDRRGLFFWDAVDIGLFAKSLYDYYHCSSHENALNLGLDALGLLPIVPALGTIRRVDDAVDAIKSVRYGPMNPGPLDEAVASTFRSGSYTEKLLSETTTFYRVYGGSANKIGHYWTSTKQNGILQSQLDLALAPKWGNTASSVVSIEVPKGTTIYEGFANSQSTGVGEILGGGSQVYIKRINPKWIQ